MNQKQNLTVFFAFALFLISLQIANYKGFSNPDSLLLELQKPYHDTVKFDQLISIGDFFEYSQPDTAILFYSRAAVLADKNLEQPNELQNNYLKLKAKALRYIGYVHLNQGDYQSASQFYFEALDIAELLDDKNSIYNCYNNIGIINHMQKEYDVAMQYYQKALDILDLTGDRSGKSKLYINVGNLYSDHGDNTQDINLKQEYYSSALASYTDAQKIKAEIGDIKGQSLCTNNLGNLHKKKGKIIENDNDRRKMYSLSRNYYYMSIQLSKSINDKSGLSLAYGNLSDLYSIVFAENWTASYEKSAYADSAIQFGMLSYQQAIDLNSIYLQNKTALLLKSIYSEIGNVKKALEYADIFIDTRDVMFAEEKTKALKEMMTKYETEKKEKEIQLQQLELHKTRFRLIMVIVVAVLAVIVITFLGYVLRLKQKTEKILELKNKQLLESNATKDKFFSIISHDLRSPVSGFRNLSTIIGQNFESFTPEQIKENVIDLSISADETVSLLNNLLQWSKSQQNKIEVKKFPTNFKRLFSKTFDELQTKLREKNITLSAELNDSFEAEMDENIISTILRNLLTNAIKFSPNNSTLEVYVSDSKEFYRVSVKDQGIGMSDEDMNKLFRIDCDTKSIGSSSEKGSGLGLILCKELITLHGGNIDVDSKLNEGSTFRFTIPKDGDERKV